MDELFNIPEKSSPQKLLPPLADRMRPIKLENIFGQEHLIGEGGPLLKFFEEKDFPSVVFWGPPGSGKTTFAQLIADVAEYNYVKISAIDSGVKDLRQIITQAQRLRGLGKKTLLFIDEIHRFNKTQQDSLLNAVEKGIITLIGATTENPSFEVNPALLSRCQVYRLYQLSDENIRSLIVRALETDEVLSKHNISIESWDFLLTVSSGDARAALNALELAFKISPGTKGGSIIITRNILEKALQQKTAYYDKHGESHYDTISAFIKSLRGSDPDAALFWLTKMLEAG
ncbi:MAG: Replication-associated recombination protein, partial [Bacteroidota bacterium]|nr:Replication-associated recombination protein [Bacteroidota bacterium]